MQAIPPCADFHWNETALTFLCAPFHLSAGDPGAVGGDRLVLQDDGNMVIYNSKTSAVVWDSGTGEHEGPNRIVLR